MASSPRILNRQTGIQTPKPCKKPLSQLIVAPRAQASRRRETQATLGGQAAKLCYRFGPLTPSARSANLIAGDGTKNGLSRSEQRTGSKTQKQPLDRKSPIQVYCELRSRRMKKCRVLDAARKRGWRTEPAREPLPPQNEPP